MTNYTSRSQKLHNDLKQIIDSTPTGEKLLTEPLLARQLGVSRATLREAMRIFETQGLLRRRQGSGTYVMRPAHVIETGLEVLESIETLARRINLEVSMGALRLETRPDSEDEAKAFGARSGNEVTSLTRVILAESRPVAYLVDVLPVDVLTVAEVEQGFQGSVLDLLLKRGTPELSNSRSEISAVTATAEIARALGIQRGDVLLKFTSYLYTTSGRVIDYSQSYFLPGYFRFHVIRRVGG